MKASSLPVFGGMALVAVIVQRQTSRKSETQYLHGCLLEFICLTSIGGVLATFIDLELTDPPWLRFALTIDIAIVSAILCGLIAINLVLRRLGFHRDRFWAESLDLFYDQRQ
jgi:MFS superfamily sulfate permease-like transporter